MWFVSYGLVVVVVNYFYCYLALPIAIHLALDAPCVCSKLIDLELADNNVGT